jgi:pimeloyl-ACP methyl ester carboxylesterase
MADTILKELPDRFALVGWSMGGYIAMEIMKKAPERVVRLGMISTSAREDPPANAPERLKSIATAEEKGPAVAWRAKMGQFFHRPEKLGPELREQLEAMNERLGIEIYRIQQHAVMRRADSRGVLKTIRCPTIVICGTHDQWTPPNLSWEIASNVPGAELHLLAECSHCSPIEDPASVNGLLSGWLERERPSHERDRPRVRV